MNKDCAELADQAWEEQHWWEPSNHWIVLYPGPYVKPWIISQDTVDKLRKVGYCERNSRSYTLNAQLLSVFPIARGSLDFLEQHQKELTEVGLNTEIVYKDETMKFKGKAPPMITPSAARPT